MVPISCLCSLTMVISHFTAPQSPPMNWWLPVPRLHPSSLSGFQTFLCNCLLNISTWVSYRHLKLNVQNCTLSSSQAKPAPTYDSSQQMTPPSTWLPRLLTILSFTGPCQSWSPLAQWVAHIADVYRYNKWRRQTGSLGFRLLSILLE